MSETILRLHYGVSYTLNEHGGHRTQRRTMTPSDDLIGGSG